MLLTEIFSQSHRCVTARDEIEQGMQRWNIELDRVKVQTSLEGRTLLDSASVMAGFEDVAIRSLCAPTLALQEAVRKTLSKRFEKHLALIW